MKKVILTSLLASSVLLGSMPALADSVAETPGHVELIENNDTTSPVNPEDPGEETDPEENGGSETGNIGPLSLDVAPAKFDFGSQNLYSTAHTYTGVNEGASSNQYLQVTDNRNADVYGWTVKVKQESFLTSSDGYELTGTVISIPAGVARNSMNTPSSDVDQNLQTSAVDIDLAEQTVFTAYSADQSGKGTSTSVWSTDEVSLTIPAGVARTGDYTNTVTWTLTAEATN